MEKSVWLHVASPNIVHEDFGDEMVVVHLDTGKYYAFNPTAADIWARLQSGSTVGALIAGTVARFDGDWKLMEREVLNFVERLLAESLTKEADPLPGEAPTFPAPPENKLPFTVPAFEVFTDMEDMLLLDPIHDVDESGWPNPPTTGN